MSERGRKKFLKSKFMDFGGAGLKLFKSIPPLALDFPAPCGTRLTEVPFPPTSHLYAITEWPARQLCFPTNLFSRVSGFASHLYRWFAFSNIFFNSPARFVWTKAICLPFKKYRGRWRQVVLNARIEQKGCQDVSGTISGRNKMEKISINPP